MNLIVQPRDGLAPLLSAIRLAKKEIDVVIFRCDRSAFQQAIEAAVKRGVHVRTLIAHTNRGGEKNLRKLEQKMLELGATVARTGDEFVRYHGKMMVVDRRTLWVLGFNFTALDIGRSRSFGIVTTRRAEVQQALKLFEADETRQPYEACSSGACQLIISPENARPTLAKFIQKARQELLIYDPKVSDREMIALLKERKKAGVQIKIMGKVADNGKDLPHDNFPGQRLHVRSIVRDRRDVFIGSQSLRALELDQRREVGIIVRQPSIVAEVVKVFEQDWAQTDAAKSERKLAEKQKDETDQKSSKKAESAA